MQRNDNSAGSDGFVASRKPARRVCLVSDDFLPAATGVGFHVQQVARELVRRGNEVSVITTRRPGEPEVETWNGVKVFRTATVRSYGFHLSVASRRTIRRILEEIRPDLVHFHWMGLLLMRTMSVIRSWHIPRMHTYHMTVAHMTQPWFMKPFVGLVSRLMVRYCNRMDLILTPSEHLIEGMRKLGIRAPVRYLSNPVSFDGDPSGRAPERAPDRFVALYVGQLNPVKNIPYLLRGFQKLTADEPRAELWLAGEGQLRQSMEMLCGELGIRSRVRFFGFVGHDDLPLFYRAADVFVLPSKVEVQPMVAMEAMLFGKPIVMSKSIVSARELVEEGRNGLLADSESPDDLARALLRMRDGEVRERMGARSLEKSRAYRVDGVVDRLGAYYEMAKQRNRYGEPDLADVDGAPVTANEAG